MKQSTDSGDDSTKSSLLPLLHRSDSSTYPAAAAAPQNHLIHSNLKSLFTRKNLFILLGPLLCGVICLTVHLDEEGVRGRNMLAVIAWVFAWWLTEAVPMPITSMTPLFLFPLLGIADADEVAHSYMDDVIALVLGSFILALAVEHYNIHRRLALNVGTIYLFVQSLESTIR